MSIRLKDTIYDLIDNSNKLGGYNRSNLYESSSAWLDAVGLTETITVTGESTKFYPVVITVSNDKKLPTYISVWKNLGTTTPSGLEGNHSNGTSSLWLRYEMRNTMWDGNGGYLKTWYKHQSYATLVAHTRSNTKGHGGLIIWLRGGTCEYKITCTNTFTTNIYYSTTNIGTTEHPDNLEILTSVDNGGIYTSTILGYGNISGNADTATKLKTARTISLTGSVTGSGSFDGSGNLSIATTTNHSHSTLTIQGNGTSLGTYNGSATKTINITCSNIGAATSGHTHNYAGSSSPGGAATSALTISASAPQLAAADESNNINIVNNANSSITTNSPENLAAITKAIRFRWYNDYWEIGSIRGGASSSVGFGFTINNNNLRFRITSDAAYVGSNTVLHTGNWSSYCAAKSHTHNYASTVKVGNTSYTCSSNVISLPAYPTTLKCPAALTIQLNGTSQGAWDGSAVKTINITYSNVGAAAASHNHNSLYVSTLGTSGNYVTWTKNGTTNNITVPYATNSDTVDSWHKDYFRIGYDGSRHYRVQFGLGGEDLDWKTIVQGSSTYTEAPTSNAWQALTIRGDIWYTTNSHNGGQLIKYPFCAIFYYVSAKSLINNAYLYLPVFAKSYDVIRIVRVSTNNFELQVRQDASWRKQWIDYQCSWSGGTVNAYTSLQTANSGTVVVNASEASTITESYASYAYDAGTLDSLDSMAFMRAENANGYYGLVAPGGANNVWIRTTTNGIIPYQSGGSGSLGTSGWPFNAAYATTFYGSLSGNASSASKAAQLTTARTLTIGNTGKTFNGTANVSWSLTEIGAAASSHTHNYAGSSSAGGAATSANKLNTDAGSATKPVYFSGGKPVAVTAPMVQYWAIYEVYFGSSGTSSSFVKKAGNHNFYSSVNSHEGVGNIVVNISYPTGFTEDSTFIFGNGDHRESNHTQPIYLTVNKQHSYLRLTLADDASNNWGYAYLYFLCIG